MANSAMTDDHYGVVMRHFAAPESHRFGRILLLPALGTPARYYDRVAGQLAAQGLDTHTLELRGAGDSPLRAARNCDFGFRELLDEDIPAALRTIGAGVDGTPVWLVGHSLGGHLATISAGRLTSVIDGIALIACGSPWLVAYDAAMRRRIRTLTMLIPLCNALLGYYPGDRIGFGGRQPRRLMRDWRQLALSGRYQAEGIEEDIEAGIAHYAGPVLSLRMADDAFAPAAATRAVTDKLVRADLSEVVLDAEALGTRADHFRWARNPDAVVAQLKTWCRSTASRAPRPRASHMQGATHKTAGG